MIVLWTDTPMWRLLERLATEVTDLDQRATEIRNHLAGCAR